MAGHRGLAAMCIYLIVWNHYVGAVAKHPRESRATGKDGEKNNDDHGKEAPKTSTARTLFYGGAIAGTLLLGFVWYQMSKGVADRRDWLANGQLLCAMFAGLLHIPAQFLPWIGMWTTTPWLSQGHVGCSYGLPWEWHLTYAVVVVAAMPFLSNCVAEKTSNGRIPIIGLGGKPFDIYNYGSTLSLAFDQYSDCAASTLAYSCGWNKAWMMVAVLATSYGAQLVAGYCLSGFRGVVSAAVSLNTESYRHGVKQSAAADYAKAHAILSVLKLITEIIPQSILSITFALEVKPNKMIWVSVVLSLTMGIKSFTDGIKYFCGGVPSSEALSSPVE